MKRRRYEKVWVFYSSFTLSQPVLCGTSEGGWLDIA